MTMRFTIGITYRPIRTPYGYGQVTRSHEDGSVDLYVGHGRTFHLPAETRWEEA